MMMALATKAPNALNFQAVKNAQQLMWKILKEIFKCASCERVGRYLAILDPSYKI